MEKVNVRGFDFKAKQQVVSTKDRPNQLTEAGIKRKDMLMKFRGNEYSFN